MHRSCSHESSQLVCKRTRAKQTGGESTVAKHEEAHSIHMPVESRLGTRFYTCAGKYFIVQVFVSRNVHALIHSQIIAA